MEKDFGSWFHHQYPDLQSAHSNFSSRGLNIGQQNSVPIYMTPHSNEVPVRGDSLYSFYGLPESKASQPTEPCNWFYCLPQFRQGFAPVLSTVVKEMLGPQSVEYLGGKENPNVGPGAAAQKRFLVIDQSGDQTTLIYSSSNGTPVQGLPSWSPQPAAPCNMIKEGPQIKSNVICPSGHHFGDEYYEENHTDNVESELHEDTEELNALLYSDDDDGNSEDGEEISTGHSPSTMTAHDLPQWLDEMGEEVASSEWPNKKRKVLDGGCDVPSLIDTATSAKPFTCSDLEDDAQSSCANSDNRVSEASVSLSGKKRPRKDEILETISVLQKIIPGVKGKDSMVVIDEAISYLRSLKVKAESLGLDTL
ncbi:transcription factor bHLH145 [Nicotiana tabacum]|uniref:Transcription factor bHLH145 n=2 Tax=Nicotiana TaxID=4085 RepID=A0A1S4B6F3_TOBAC|nr:PREDICTED: transcription factor bHLH145-like [Nicotiana sylvestris]XP_016484378.1 PREDICTED: transcription factor bHLH145-like isoform X1 [Nicotiana tabacum]